MDRFVIWGTGKRAAKQLKYLSRVISGHEIDIVGFADNNPDKWGSTFEGRTVYPPEKLQELEFDYIDIWVAKAQEAIRQQITGQLNISPEKIKSMFEYYKEDVCQFYRETDDAEVREFIENFEKQEGIGVFAYQPVQKDKDREAFLDRESGLYYVDFEGKRLYLSRTYDGFIEKEGKKWISGLWQEQDLNSPHRYEMDEVEVKEGDVLVDAGVCEGNFSLHNIDKVKKVYLIECDPDWMEALQHTFRPYQEKVVFCNKFLSDEDAEDKITLDTLVKEPVDFIKMDIEGEEIKALQGADRVLSRSKNLKCSICAYHRHGDEEKIKEILSSYGLQTAASQGYMLFLYDMEVWKKPELRRGLVRGHK